MTAEKFTDITDHAFTRREFLRATAALAALGFVPWQASSALSQTAAVSAHDDLTCIFLTILDGFLRNARNTDPTCAVCDFPDGTMLKGCSTPSGKTYVSVARMMPSMAVWLKSGNASRVSVDGSAVYLRQIMLSIFQHAFDPAHPNYWGEANTAKADQRQVEACLVAYTFWLMGEDFARDAGPAARTQLQNWLASCTVVPEHKHNHAWFSAMNQVARLQLAKRWPEFKGDEAWMNADLAALDSMARPEGEGWYNDYPGFEVYDWYNSWTYASHFLYWKEIVGDSYPQWTEKFLPRLQKFLEHTPKFFAANGSHVLFGRSLIYRWAAVLPMVLAYRHKVWPHSPGLLRAIVRRNIDFFWKAGAYDEERSKLRETFAPGSSPGIRERYIDNGHPYWCMQSFALLGIPKNDPFWTDPEEPLPVERNDYQLRYPGLGMTLLGTKGSGQVRWLSSRNLHRPAYRDKYIKFGYSSHFPFNVLDETDACPWDQALLFRNIMTGESAGRSGIGSGSLLADGSLLIHWECTLGTAVFYVITRVRLFDEFEERTHVISALDPVDLATIELLEGSYSHGLADAAECETQSRDNWLWSRNRDTGAVIFTANLHGYGRLELSKYFLRPDENTNVMFPRKAVNTLRADAGLCTGTFVGLHYASPAPHALDKLVEHASQRRVALMQSDLARPITA